MRKSKTYEKNINKNLKIINFIVNKKKYIY